MHQQTTLTRSLIAWSAVMTILAGAIHLWLVPVHFEHAPAHALFFLVVGIAQIGWGIAVWMRPTMRLYYVGAVMAGGLIVLYVLTRVLPAPFAHSPESVAAIDVVCKACEGLAMFSLGILLFQGMLLNAGRSMAWRVVGIIVLASFAAAFLTYGAARAAEPLLPALSGTGEHHEEQGIHSPGGDTGLHDEAAPTEEHQH